MIIGSDLEAWTASRPRQRRTRAGADALAIEWAEGPVHRRFTEAFANLPTPTAEAVAHAASSLLADDGWVDVLIDALAAAMCDDPYFEPPFRHLNSDIHRGLIAFENDLVSIAVGVIDIHQLAAKKSGPKGRASIIFSGQVEVFRLLKAGGARFSFWSAPPITAAFSAATAGRCERAGERAIADGETLLIDGRRESFVIEHAAANLLVLQATVKPDRAPVGVEYDAVSREYAGCSAADDSASRIQMITTLLRKLDCSAAFPAIAVFLDHPSFFVRWHVIRELLGLDATAALPHLRRMAARDPHPETRGVARTVLDRIEARPEKRREAA